MSHIVISSFENVDTGDLQAQGESISVFGDEPAARHHFSNRVAALDAAVHAAREHDAAATFISWVLLLKMPIEVADADEALEDLETVIAETDNADDPFGEWVVAYQGRRLGPAGTTDHPQRDALNELEAWLT